MLKQQSYSHTAATARFFYQIFNLLKALLHTWLDITQISTSVQQTTEVVPVFLPAITMTEALSVPVIQDTIMMEQPAQVS